ncbi:complex I intermediate-associated protein CIA30 [Rhodofomes roseus]|uniref:Complex I intermediate-associated protein CIA30 n=1 Tax=Rhodofomes roseus TaxID=34475 RepID=A0ABQ8KL87_9APHY|nr:complex I intermediate-associated protein CIA30 [Rhodofomes roseus]KAH9838668.1 complex I intermediate-associated protein CIA30 [Rhodofomes roseus]
MSRFSAYLNRSSKLLRDNTSSILRMSGADEPIRTPVTLFNFNSHEDIQQFATGCDADVGGTSTVNLALDESTGSPSASNEKLAELRRPTAKFWGEMRLNVRHGLEGRIRGGYAGFRSKARTYLHPRTSLFGEITNDVSLHKYLGLRVRGAGHPRTRNSYYVNIQTDGPITTDLWQHRLYFRRDDGGWEDIFIPFDAFVLTNVGEVSYEQMEMFRERVRTVGISLLGGNSGVEGPYELGIDSIFAVNEEDVPPYAAPKHESSDGTRWERPAI